MAKSIIEEFSNDLSEAFSSYKVKVIPECANKWIPICFFRDSSHALSISFSNLNLQIFMLEFSPTTYDVL